MSTKKYALVSTWNKEGVGPFAQTLHDAGYTILSTGGTARALTSFGVPVRSVAEHTGSGELCDGRVKTLHPRVHAGILGDRRAHAEEVAEAGVVGFPHPIKGQGVYAYIVLQPGFEPSDALQKALKKNHTNVVAFLRANGAH